MPANDTAAELAAIRIALIQLTTSVRNLANNRYQARPAEQQRGRSRTREHEPDRARSSSASTSGLCFAGRHAAWTHNIDRRAT